MNDDNIKIENYKETAKIFKAFCDENRLMILELLQESEKCACVLLKELSIVQSTLSHHMKILVDSGMVSSKKNGKWTNYALCIEGFVYAKKLLDDFSNISRGGDYKCK